MRRWLLAGVLALVIVGPVAAVDLDDEQRRGVLAEAQQAYDRGIELRRGDPVAADRLFRLAAERFALLVDDGVRNGRLYYNLANAHLQAGELGRAVVNYRRAGHYIPGDERLESNLAYARSLVRNRIEPRGGRALGTALLAWHHQTRTSSRVTIFAVAWIGFWCVLLAMRLRPRPALRWVAAGLALIWLTTGASVGADLLLPERPIGVVVVDEVMVRKGNGEGFEPQFEQPLYQGVEFELLEQRGEWLLIRLPDGGEGWIRAGQAEMV